MLDRWVYVTAYDPDGRPTHATNVTAWLGTDQYAQRVAVLRRGLLPGHTLDTAVADALHRRLVVHHSSLPPSATRQVCQDWPLLA